MALLRTLELLRAGERAMAELQRSVQARHDGRFVARPLDPWAAYRRHSAAAARGLPAPG